MFFLYVFFCLFVSMILLTRSVPSAGTSTSATDRCFRFGFEAGFLFCFVFFFSRSVCLCPFCLLSLTAVKCLHTRDSGCECVTVCMCSFFSSLRWARINRGTGKPRRTIAGRFALHRFPPHEGVSILAASRSGCILYLFCIPFFLITLG